MGPLLILLLLLIIGPCVLDRLVAFIRAKLSTVQLLVLRQQYHALKDQVHQGEYSV
jgi:multisubunit Na+/H+ antiporter MnhF subunit